MISLQLVAVHEAGHCCVSLALGHHPLSATIERDGDSLGSYSVRFVPRDGADLARDRLLVVLAGPMAQVMYTYGHDRDYTELVPDSCEGGDYQNVIQLVRILHPAGHAAAPAEILDVVRDASHNVQTILRKPKVWRNVIRLAGALLADRSLSGEWIRKILAA